MKISTHKKRYGGYFRTLLVELYLLRALFLGRGAPPAQDFKGRMSRLWGRLTPLTALFLIVAERGKPLTNLVGGNVPSTQAKGDRNGHGDRP